MLSASGSFAELRTAHAAKKDNMENTCFVCGLAGHIARDCGLAVTNRRPALGSGPAMPESQGQAPQPLAPEPNASESDTCHWCKQQGHMMAGCPRRQAGEPQVPALF